MTTDIDKVIGHRIRMRRKELELSSTELAQQLGISQQHLSRLEKGMHRITVSQFVQIAGVLNTSVNWFLTDCYKEQETDFVVDIHAKRRNRSKK